MLKKLQTLDNSRSISRSEQQKINGGTGTSRDCETYCRQLRVNIGSTCYLAGDLTMPGYCTEWGYMLY